MSMYEIGDNPSFEDLKKFTRNLLLEGARLPDGTSEAVSAKLVYLNAVTNVHVAEKMHVALGSLAMAVQEASVSSSIGAENALEEARRMLTAARWLVVGTIFLALATSGLVFYARELAMTELPAATEIERPVGTEPVDGPNP